LINAIKLSRHTPLAQVDCLHPGYMEVIEACHPWFPDYGNSTGTAILLFLSRNKEINKYNL
jgi:hypothetical protein